jgi:heterodisulfide reductase subunit C/mono/diheme cytochrome c family protein
VSRLAAVARALFGLCFRAQALKLLAAFLWDILFQGRLLRQSRLRWLGHMAVCYSFLLLILIHALDDWTAPYLFSDYAPTMDPFRWWRNGLALLVLGGVLGMLIGRRRRAAGIHTRSWGDRLAVALMAVIVLSGVMLESAQILSPTIFADMVEDYMGADDPAEVAALQRYWAAEFGAVPIPSLGGAMDDDTEAGQAAHEAYCASCHSRPQSAFLSYPASRLLKPAAGWMDTYRVDDWLWVIHYLASCLALAILPFSQFFHLVATPVNLMAQATGPVTSGAPVLRATRRALGMDACTHCGVCTTHCSVAPIYRVIPNTDILPSAKLNGVKRLATRRLSASQTKTLAEGSAICTLCGRCTRVCPSGIDLQDLWQASREDLTASRVAILDVREAFRPGGAAPSLPPPGLAGSPPASLGLTDRPEVFWACVQCTTCTSVCPVVAASDDPQGDLDLTPQQIMNLMRLQLKEQALGCRMLWDCVTCYKCQEHCPQDVKVADILYELRNAAYQGVMPPQPMAADNH